jgi:hypothetical protein
MTPRPASDSILTKVPTPITGEWALKLLVSESAVRPDYVITDGMAYKDLRIDLSARPEVDFWGNYILTQVTDGPPGYNTYWFGKPKTEEEAFTPYYDKPGDSEHYEWPAVLHGILFAEDPEFPVTINIGVNLTIKRERLVAKEQKTERTFALCKTRVKKYLSPTPFEVPDRPQPATSEVEWVINGQTFKLSCLHDELTLPAAGKNWSPKFTVGQVNGLPRELRTFPATPMTDWEPFVTSQTHRQREADGLYELIEQWIIPPNQPELTTL